MEIGDYALWLIKVLLSIRILIAVHVMWPLLEDRGETSTLGLGFLLAYQAFVWSQVILLAWLGDVAFPHEFSRFFLGELLGLNIWSAILLAIAIVFVAFVHVTQIDRWREARHLKMMSLGHVFYSALFDIVLYRRRKPEGYSTWVPYAMQCSFFVALVVMAILVIYYG